MMHNSTPHNEYVGVKVTHSSTHNVPARSLVELSLGLRPPSRQMDVSHQLVTVLACVVSLIPLVTAQECGPGLTLTYTKVPNMVPRTAYPPVLLHAHAPGIAITAICYNRCRESQNCDGFIVDYKQGACYRVNAGHQIEEYQQQPSVNFFRKVCLKVPAECAERAWPMEYIPGYKLLAEQKAVLPNVADKWQCAQMCLDQSSEGGESCRSSQYQAWSRTCTLSQYDRHTRPEHFSPTVSTDREFEYMENQCPSGRNTDVLPSSHQYCWHDPVFNRTSMRSDLEIDNITVDQCERRCQTEVSFRCFAFTYQCPVYGDVISRCMLHSDQVQQSAPPLLPMPCATYKERISCLDVRVTCSPQTMTITLIERMFSGQMFVSNHASDCSASNTGQESVVLIIPLPSNDYSPNPCDVQIQSTGNQNRTVASAVIVIQHHKLIQTVSDRIVQASCYLGLDTAPLPPQYNNFSLNASFYVKDPMIVQNVIEGFGNNNNATYPPTAVMRIVDVGRGGPAASQIELGDELELQIFVNSLYNVSMIRAGHLIASSGSGQDSILLLDWRGCPPDPTTFPALSPANSSALVARFRAFKFPDSNVLRFSVILTFCVSTCQPTDCGNGMTSYGKRRRRRSVEEVMEEVPLQLEIIITTPNSDIESPPKTHLSENGAEMGRSDTGLVCASLASTLVLGVAWVAIQILLLVCCCWALAHRDKPSDCVRLQEDFQPKHVTWGDVSAVSSTYQGHQRQTHSTRS